MRVNSEYNGERYTKHFYVGSQRVVSKIGDPVSYIQDPNSTSCAGNGIRNIDYNAKYLKAIQAVKDNYAHFEETYRGTDNNTIGGGNYCHCQYNASAYSAPAMVSGNFDPVREDDQYFYHPDHLGSTTMTTDAGGHIAQRVEYIPFGEVFVEERNNTWHTPFLFNAKELDEETGLYYYGARYYDPRTSLWLSVDPLAEGKPGVSAYAYCLNNPVRLIDPDGRWERDENGNLKAEKGDNAWTLAKYLNTSAEISIKMLEQQGFSVNEKGKLNLKVGDVFVVEHSSRMPGLRNDLGYIGNNIRKRAGSEFSKDLFENYWRGDGDVELSGKRFAGILIYIMENNPKASDPSPVIFKDSEGNLIGKGDKRAVSFYSSPEYDKAFGTSTLYYNSKGNIIGFYDEYDFDSKPWGERTTKNEVITRAVETFSPNKAKDFKIRFGYSNRDK